MLDPTSFAYACLCLGTTAYLVQQSIKAWVARSKLDHIPTVGPSGMLWSYVGAYKMLHGARDLIQEGYDKYYGAAFKVPTISSWIVVASGPQMAEDLRKASDEFLSSEEATAELIQMDYTLGPDLHHDPYHVAIVRTSLTRNLGMRFLDIQDEIAASFADLIPATKEWVRVPVQRTVMKIVSRTSNRLFVGLPICRNADYMALTQEFAIQVFQASYIINLFPDVFKPIAGRLFTKVPASIKRAIAHLGPTIQDRLDKGTQYGPNWLGKPNDLISWLLESTPAARPHSVETLTMRILTINVGAIHTTSMAFTQVLYDLAAYPSYVPALREEIEEVMEKEGLTKSALSKMRKVDSFIKESQRIGGVGAVSMLRKVMKDFTFSNGTTVPAGATVVIAGYPTHHDEKNYPNPGTFDGLRFANLRKGEGESLRHQMVSLSSEYVIFGNGRHACPGRFFAVNEVKALLVHVVLNYDVKLETEGVRPPNRWFGLTALPHPTAVIMFRKRSGFF